MSENYKIVSVAESKDHLKVESRTVFDFDSQLKNNKAFVYFLKSAEVILLPNNLLDSSKGIIFKKKQFFEDCLRDDKFPLGNESIRLEERYQSEISQIDKIVPNIVTSLSESLNYRSDTKDLSGLLEKARDMNAKANEKEYLYSALLLGEYVRRMHKGNWILLKEYGTFNPYYTPGIIYPDSSVVIIRNIFDFFSHSELSPEKFGHNQFIQEPKLNLKNWSFKQDYPDYKILR